MARRLAAGRVPSGSGAVVSASELTEAQRAALELVDDGAFIGGVRTATLETLEWAQLVYLTDWRFGTPQWRLTDAGRAALRGGK